MGEVVGMMSLLVFLMGSAQQIVANPGVYKVWVSELGTDFEETVKVYPGQGVAVIHVPAHNTLSEATFIIDYNTKTMTRHIPSAGKCYVSALDDVSTMTSPAEMRRSLIRAKRAPVTDDVTSLQYHWRVAGPVRNTSRLSDLALNLCSSLPTMHLEKMTSSVQVIGDRRLQKRQLSEEESCTRTMQKFRCRIGPGLSCCRYLMMKTCNPMNDMHSSMAMCNMNRVMHVMDSMECCTRCCKSSDQASVTFPYCEGLRSADLPTSC